MLCLVLLHACLLVCAVLVRRYGWGRNADKLELPKGVGFSVGKGSAVKWIVMQVHYLKEKPAGDNAGVRLRWAAAGIEPCSSRWFATQCSSSSRAHADQRS